jgi:hypothetical protein
MATTTTLCPTMGALWLQVLALWDQYATGTFTSWSFATHNVSGFYGKAITVGLSGGGTDVHQLVALDCPTSGVVPLAYALSCPGWRNPPPNVYPDTLPDGGSCVTKYSVGPVALRTNWLSNVCGATIGVVDNDFAGPAFGVSNTIFYFDVSFGLQIMVDATGVMHGTLAADGLLAYPGDYVGSSVPVAGGGGGGSVDLGPVVDALEDIATMDVEYQANNGGTVWSMRGKVRAP